MDLVDQLQSLKGRPPRRRRPGDEPALAHGPKGAPDPQALAALLDGAEVVELNGGRLLLRRTVQEAGELRAVGPLLDRALEAAVPLDQVVAIDTETTGLAGGTGTVAFLIGLARWESGHLVLDQALMPDYPDEPALLAWLARQLDRARALLSYNGKTFDLPLLRTRWRMHGERDVARDALPHLDLLHVVRRLFAHRLRTCSLENAERAILEARRQGDLPGKAAPRAFFRYLDGHELETMAAVFHHNAHDTVSILHLTRRIAALYADPERETLGDPSDWLGLAEWAEALGDLDRARHVFGLALTALRGTPQRTRIELRLAGICERTGREDEARALWRSVAERDPLAGWPAVKELARAHEQRQEWRESYALLDGAWQRFDQVRALRQQQGLWKLPAAWRQWMADCERLRRRLRQAASEEQLALPI